MKSTFFRIGIQASHNYFVIIFFAYSYFKEIYQSILKYWAWAGLEHWKYVLTIYVLMNVYQINTMNLEKDSFWVKANEERLANDEIFRGLTMQFAFKVTSKLKLVETCLTGTYSYFKWYCLICFLFWPWSSVFQASRRARILLTQKDLQKRAKN